MATGSAGGLAALSGRPAGTTPLHDFNRENLPQGQNALTTKQGAEPFGGREHADGLGI
jgi:hypothetical protein